MTDSVKSLKKLNRESNKSNKEFWEEESQRQPYKNTPKDFLVTSSYKDNRPFAFDKLIPKKKFISTSINEKDILIPFELEPIAKAIKESKYILDLEAGWDDDSAIKIEKDIWISSVNFLINYSKYILDTFYVVIMPPEINPCGNGTIDLSWRSKKARFLINFKRSDSKIFASYYGDLYDDKQRIKDILLNPKLVNHLAYWMQYLT